MYHALKIVGVDQAEEIIQSRYANMLEDDTINKVSFVFILEQEHRRNGFLNQGIWKLSNSYKLLTFNHEQNIKHKTLT